LTPILQKFIEQFLIYHLTEHHFPTNCPQFPYKLNFLTCCNIALGPVET